MMIFVWSLFVAAANAQTLAIDYDFSRNLNDSMVRLVPMAAKRVLTVTNASDPSGVGASKLHLVVPPEGYTDDLVSVKVVYKMSLRIGLDAPPQDPPPTGDAGLRLTRGVGFWLGFRLLMLNWTTVPQEFMPLVLMKTDDWEESRIAISSNGTELVFENRYQNGKIVAATRERVALRRSVWQYVVLYYKRSAGSDGVMRAWLNGVSVCNMTNVPVGVVRPNDEDPYVVFTLDGGKAMPTPADEGVANDLFIDNVRVAQTDLPSGRSLVEPDDTNKCRNALGKVGCYCRDDMANPCDGATSVCAKIEAPGYCTDAQANFTTCKFLGTAQCPCASGLCSPGLLCRSMPANSRPACWPLSTTTTRNSTAPAEMNSTEPVWTFGCNTTTTMDGYSCPIPSVSPADWFAVIIAALLLIAALVRWSSKLFISDPAAIGPARVTDMAADDYMISGGMAYMDYVSQVPSQPPSSPTFAQLAAGGSLGSNSQYQASPIPREPQNVVYRPLPVAEGDMNARSENNAAVFEIYSKLPQAPVSEGVEDQARLMAGVKAPPRSAHRSNNHRFTRRMTHVVTDASGHQIRVSESLASWFSRMLGSRVFGQVRMRDVVLAVLYVLLHIGFFFAWQDDCLYKQMFGGVWYQQVRAIGSTFGYMATTNSLLLALPATRNSLLGLLLGLEFDETILFHRWLGVWTLILLVLHGIPYVPMWINVFDRFLAYRTQCAKFHWACTCVIVCVILAVTARDKIRRNHFQVFYWCHFFFILYYVAGAMHSQKVMLRFALVTLGFYVLDRFLRFVWGLWPRRCIANVSKGADLCQIVFTKTRWANYAVGNYVFLNFPQISFWEWHPFTLSSGPHDEFNEVHIKALGDFTGDLLRRVTSAALTQERLWVRVDGPYGHFSLHHERYPVVVLLGGGVGITPHIAALKDIYRIRMTVVARVEHARRGHIKHVYFVWVCPDMEHAAWFTDVINDCLQRHAEDATYPALHVFVHLTKQQQTNDVPQYIQFGRPDYPLFFDLICSERAAELRDSPGAVFACGPSMMVNAAWDATTSASKKYPGCVFAIHKENFDF